MADRNTPPVALDPATLDWSLIRSFTAVMRTGNLTRAAKALKTTQPTVGRHIRKLEELVGDVLFDRVPGGLRPTARATELFERAEALDDAVRSFSRLLSGTGAGLTGTVRLTTTHVFGSFIMPEVLAALMQRHPQLEIELLLSDGLENLLRREADIAVRFFKPEQDDLIAVKIGTISLGLFARRDYFERIGRPVPKTVNELPGHVFIGDEQALQATGFARANGLDVSKKDVRFRSASMVGQLAAIRAGIGIGPAVIRIAAKEQALVRVLPDITVACVPMWIVAHDDLNRSARMRAVFDHLTETMPRLVD